MDIGSSLSDIGHSDAHPTGWKPVVTGGWVARHYPQAGSFLILPILFRWTITATRTDNE